MTFSPASDNPYCARLGIAVPRIEDMTGRKGVKLFHLMAVAILERGGPMSIEEIVRRLESAGVLPATGDLPLSLQKAWHGRKPVYRDPDGKFGLLLDCNELKMLLWITGLEGPAKAVRPSPPDPVLPGDDAPLSNEELEAALRDRGYSGPSALRAAAAVLDATDRPMTLGEINDVLASLTGLRPFITAGSLNSWKHTTLVATDDGGRLALRRESSELIGMRRAIRKIAHPILLRRAREAEQKKRYAEFLAREAESRPRLEREAAAMRRAILHAVPGAGGPRAFVVLDMNARATRTFIGDEASALPDALATFDILAGLDILDLLHALRLDPARWRLADLNPPQKTYRLNRQGRTLTVTPRLLIAGTTGISRALGDPAKVAEYLLRGDTGKLARRLESDAKALFAFYQFGVLHRCVRLRWGFLDDIFPVSWAMPGDPNLHDLLERARQADAPVDLVLRTAPGWNDPWSRARRVKVVDIGPWQATVREGEMEFPISRLDIQAMRIVEGDDKL
jgi:hypothetical protein